MLDIKKLNEIINSASEQGDLSMEKFKQQFISGLSDPNDVTFSAEDVANEMIDSVNQICHQMNSKIDQQYQSLQNNISEHHKEQANKKPCDFNVDEDIFNDLREKSSTGFPFEDSEFFANLPKYK